jgi:hypothetical protein
VADERGVVNRFAMAKDEAACGVYAGLERLAELAEAGKVRPHGERQLPLAKGHELVARDSTRGKVVLTV